MTALQIDSAARRALRADAHHLDPVVMIGGDGLTDAVLKEADAALKAHTLIKVRVLGDDRLARQAVFDRMCDALGAAAVQHIGKLLILWRPAQEDEDDQAATPGANSANSARGAAPREVKILKFSKNPGRRPEVKRVQVLGNQRVTPGGLIKRAKKRMSSKKTGG